MKGALRRIVLAMLLALSLGVGGARVAHAGGTIRDVILVFGIGYAVRVFGDEINDFLNSALAQRGVRWEGRTRVVPMVSIGSGIFVGAAQVAGPPDRVDDVRAVGAGEFRLFDRARIQPIFPLNTTNPLRGFRRVPGVGVTAIIDFRV